MSQKFDITGVKNICTLKIIDKNLGIYAIELNRPTVKNALNVEMLDLLSNHVETASKETNCHAIILRSLVPGVFCSGADLKERTSMPIERVGDHVQKMRNLFQRFYRLPQLTIAALDGSAFGGGLELALSADMRITTDTSKLGLVETKLGIIPGAGGTQRLARLIGTLKAKELIFSGSIIDGQLAEQLGLVNQSIKIDHTTKTENNSNENRNVIFPAYERSLELTTQILQNCSPLSIRCAKKAIDEGMNTTMENGLEIERTCYETVIYSNDRLEGLKAFTEKRKPIFKGN